MFRCAHLMLVLVGQEVVPRLVSIALSLLLGLAPVRLCPAQTDLYSPINAPLTFTPSAANALADLYREAMKKPLEEPTRLSPDIACAFGHTTGDSVVVDGSMTRDSIVITRVTSVPTGTKCAATEFIGILGFADGVRATDAEARITWTTMCDNLQDSNGAFLVAVVYGVALTKHPGPTPLLWGCYRLLPFGKAPLHVLK